MASLNAMHAKMHKMLAAVGGRIDAVFYCPHSPDEGCACRKPKPGLFHADRRALRRRPGQRADRRATACATCRPARPPAASRTWSCTGKGAACRGVDAAARVPAGTRVHEDLAAFADFLLERDRLPQALQVTPSAWHFIRSVVHALWMLVTVIPWGICHGGQLALEARHPAVLDGACAGSAGPSAARALLLGIKTRVSGMENLPHGQARRLRAAGQAPVAPARPS